MNSTVDLDSSGHSYKTMKDTDKIQPSTASSRTNADDDADANIFHDSPVSRRQFVRLSAITAGAIALPGEVVARHKSEKATDLYDFIRNHVPSDYNIPTLILLEGEAGFDALDTLDLETTDEVPAEIHQTTEPEGAAYAQLTPAQASDVLEVDEVTEVSFSPGSNPFWKLDNYENGVFPDESDSVDFINFEQMIDGFTHLESQHEDRLNFYSIGESAGHYNISTGEPEPQDMWVAEITNDINNQEKFQEKEKAVFGLSIHGDEPAGREAGSRFIEEILEGNEPEMDALLDDIVVVCFYANPDGWIVRNPQYIGSGQRNDFERQNAARVDLNRSFPEAAWMNPANYPAEPDGTNLIDDQPNEIDDDVPEEIVEHVPEALAMVQQLREYSNVDTLIDMHNMGQSDTFILSLEDTWPADPEQLHDVNEMVRVIGEYIHDEIGDLEDNLDALSQAIIYEENDDERPDPEDLLPERLYDYGSVVDTLGYATSGAFPDWISGPEEYGGLGINAITIEVTSASALNLTGEPSVYVPEFEAVQNQAYRAAIRATCDHVYSQIDTSFETGGLSTAYVTTDALTRSSDNLMFADTEWTTERTSTTIEQDEDDTVSFHVAEEASEISVHVEHNENIVAYLINTSGAQTHIYDSLEENGREAEWMVTDPAAGDWTVEIENRSENTIDVTVVIDEITTDDDILAPDPREVLGYEQREYTVTPFQYLEDYSNYLVDNGKNRTIDPISIEEIRDGSLHDNGDLVYDNLVIIHDEGLDDAAYIEALDTFVNTGGNLILTDRGGHLLGSLHNNLITDIHPDEIMTIEHQFALLGDEPYTSDQHEMGKNFEHRLLENVRPIQQELWNAPSLGYASSEIEVPMTVVDSAAFEAAGGTVAATTDGQVSIGAIERDDGKTGIQVISSLLPPANQRHLHPFGLRNYALEFLGQIVFTNALNYEQHRFVDGELTELWRDEETATPD